MKNNKLSFLYDRRHLEWFLQCLAWIIYICSMAGEINDCRDEVTRF